LYAVGVVLFAAGRSKAFWRDLYAVNLGFAAMSISLLEINLSQVDRIVLAIGLAAIASFIVSMLARIPEGRRYPSSPRP
jgi:hypothetical protein